MKKEFFAFILILFILSFVCSQEQEEVISTNPQIQVTSDFENASNSFLEQEIVIPEQLNTFTKFLFGINSGNKMDFSTLIIFLALWIILLLVFQAILEIVPFFGEGWKSWVAAVCVNLLVSTSGGITNLAVSILDLRRLFGWLGNFSFFFIVLNIIILVMLGWGLKSVLHLLKHKGEVSQEEMLGMEAGAATAATLNRIKRK